MLGVYDEVIAMCRHADVSSVCLIISVFLS